ncbi:hypothetical protein [Thalassotalea eurytherma]|uniref:DUF3718 domain-containing protein n=1 Tax=Thalassotalea eurytherma TaxID=1144278 RepID=A0ABQ6GZ40_9GAMM|nr:hypothetical protein [Thalassotalea eurytherma]GLX81132.1 hypothetical protein theurythT_05840 [Thalassotalea eurytherma]
MRIKALVLSIWVSSGVFATQIEVDRLSSPTIERVTAVHEYCLEQHGYQNDANTKNMITQCVNVDLSVSAYRTFKTRAGLTSFISHNAESEI